MQWSGKRVLVTGAGGFMASHLIPRLIELGADVRALCRYTSSGNIGLLELMPRNERPEIVFGDLRDAHAVLSAARGVDAVMHLGAVISVPYSRVHPAEVIETNVTGSLNVLMAARETEAMVLIVSTSETYGTAAYVPIDEDHPPQGQSPYAASKIAQDKIAESFWCSYNLPVAVVRPFNTYGPGQSARAFIPACIIQALGRGEVHVGYQEPTRDFTYVSDTVEGFIKAIECDCMWGKVANLCTGVEISVGDLARKICELVGADSPIIEEEERKGPAESEVWRLLGDNRRAKELMGWEPSVSLDEGLQMTVDWVRQHIDRYDPWRYAV